MKKTILGLTAAVSICTMARANVENKAAEEAASEWNWSMGEGLSYGETTIVSGEASIAFDSKFLSYGIVQNKDPVLVPSGEVTFYDLLTIGIYGYFDVTKYGRRAGYTSRQFQCIEMHPYVELGHSFSPEDYEWLPTTIDVTLGYDYEYIPNTMSKGSVDEDYGLWDKTWSEDTQFWTFEIGLPDLWLEPALYFERDTMRDDGTYVNLSVGHTFNLLGEEDDTLTLRPSVAQGFGNGQRVKGYLERVCPGVIDEEGEMYTEPLNHSGLMDTMIKAELCWAVCDGVEISGYVGYSDFLFDREIRRASRTYEYIGKWDESWNFIAGLAATFSF